MMPTRTREAYQFIREKLLLGEFMPGARLTEAGLAKEIGISATPVREAINRLASDGLVEKIEGFGTFVRKPSRDEVAHLYEVRTWLECGAVAKVASGGIGEEWLQQLETTYAQMKEISDLVEQPPQPDQQSDADTLFLKLDYEFHMLIIRATENPWVSKILADLQILSQIFGHPNQKEYTREPGNTEKTCRDHAAIIELLRQGDVEAAVEHMRRHLEVAKQAGMKHRPNSTARDI